MTLAVYITATARKIDLNLLLASLLYGYVSFLCILSEKREQNETHLLKMKQIFPKGTKYSQENQGFFSKYMTVAHRTSQCS